jgi:hypothetical protein
MAVTREQLISQAHLREIFDYRDGKLFWKYDRHQRAQWNAKMSGIAAGYQEKNGYITVFFNATERNGLAKSRPIALHRLIFCFHHGYYPPQVDHINGDRMDSRIENLRPALSYQNNANRKKMRNNTTGVPGVRKHRDGRYEARVCFNGKRHQVGSFTRIEDAAAAIEAASRNIKGEWHYEGASA